MCSLMFKLPLHKLLQSSALYILLSQEDLMQTALPAKQDLMLVASSVRLICAQVLLDGIVDQPHAPIAKLPLLTEADTEQLDGLRGVPPKYANLLSFLLL